MEADERISDMDKAAVRTGIVGYMTALLMGPLEEDETLSSPPADTYLTGILWPQGEPVSGDEDDASEADSGGDAGAEGSVPGYRAQRPCSAGITFAADASATVVISLGRTARYVSQTNLPTGDATADSSARGSRTSTQGWTRTQLNYVSSVASTETRTIWKTSTFTRPDGSSVTDDRIGLHIRRRISGTQLIWTVTLINMITDEGNDAEPRDARCLFQSEIVIRAWNVDGSPAIRPRHQTPPSGDDEDALTNALLYRNDHEFAVGHGVAAVWEDSADTVVSTIQTSWLPEARVRGTSPDGSPTLNRVSTRWPDVLHAGFLSREEGRADAVAALMMFADCYEEWIRDTLIEKIGQFEGSYLTAAQHHLARCQYTLDRIRDGTEILRASDPAWTAFTLANRAMNRQSLFASKGDRRREMVWRPFQLAFMLLVLPGIVDPTRKDRDCMDLLWFPTGGGKTEAYLAITAFQIFFRRLTDAERGAEGGVDVIMRYTLRLLTVQQFQRAAALITACDLIRNEDARLGSARITLGLYVGSEATPNLMDDARRVLQEEQAGETPRSTPRQLLRCPVCGGELQSPAYWADPLLPRIDITCQAKKCEVGGKSLPVMTVDETMYASPPSLLIGTIDKFAQIPRRTDIRRLFGLDGALRPGLIIQDELHLISGPLGSMAGLYETVVDLMCTVDTVRPKIIGSTATIGQAERQVKALFNRSVLQFPPPGFDAGDSFFAVTDNKGPDRLYVGVSNAGRSPKFALQAIIATLLQSAEAIRAGGKAESSAIDPYWTCVAYFNSLRELGGAYVLMQDDVPRQMQFLATRLGISRREMEMQPEELSSRVPSRELPSVLQGLEAGLPADDNPYAPPPKDAVLASNMISVGVDVPRLGLMVVNGQPKSTAEYIQSSSRVGRGMPGLVVTLYNFGRPRDLSHFEHFRGYHAALYRRVEATSVTPWAPRARDKALHAVLIAAIRHLVPGLSGDADAVTFDPTLPEVKELIAQIQARIDITSDGVEAPDAAREIRAVLERWSRRSKEGRDANLKLNYWEKKAPYGKTAPYLMCAAEEGGATGSLAWRTPNTMREVEPSTAFILKRIERKEGGDDGSKL